MLDVFSLPLQIYFLPLPTLISVLRPDFHGLNQRVPLSPDFWWSSSNRESQKEIFRVRGFIFPGTVPVGLLRTDSFLHQRQPSLKPLSYWLLLITLFLHSIGSRLSFVVPYTVPTALLILLDPLQMI